MQIIKFHSFLLLALALLISCKKENISVEDWIENNKVESRLDLSKKEIGTLPASITKLASVEELTLQYDSLTSIPPEIGGLSKLRILNLFGNPISELPTSMEKLQNLEILLLGRTELKAVPIFLSKLTKLRILALDDTKLSLSETDVEILSKIPSLEILDLTLLRHYKTLPKNISKLSHLKEISFHKILFDKADVTRLRDELPGVRIKL